MNTRDFLKTLSGAMISTSLPPPISELKIETAAITVPVRKLQITNVSALLEKWKRLLDFDGTCDDGTYCEAVVTPKTYTCDTQNPRIMCACELERMEREISTLLDDEPPNGRLANKWGKKYVYDNNVNRIVVIEDKMDLFYDPINPAYTNPTKLIIPEIRKAWSPNYRNGWLKWYDLKLLEDGNIVTIKRVRPRI